MRTGCPECGKAYYYCKHGPSPRGRKPKSTSKDWEKEFEDECNIAQLNEYQREILYDWITSILLSHQKQRLIEKTEKMRAKPSPEMEVVDMGSWLDGYFTAKDQVISLIQEDNG